MSDTVKTLSGDECFLLLQQLQKSPDTARAKNIADRNRTMALLMLDAGLRVGEVVSLYIIDLWWADSPVTTLLIRAEVAKTRTERSIPLTPRLRDAIQGMANSTWQLPTHTSPYAFAKGPLGDSHLTTRQVERIIRRAGLMSMNRTVHPHLLRHTFATRLMRRTSIKVVQELLGHASLTSTQIYTHPNQDDKELAIKKLLYPTTDAGELSTPGTAGPDSANNIDARRTDRQ